MNHTTSDPQTSSTQDAAGIVRPAGRVFAARSSRTPRHLLPWEPQQHTATDMFFPDG